MVAARELPVRDYVQERLGEVYDLPGKLLAANEAMSTAYRRERESREAMQKAQDALEEAVTARILDFEAEAQAEKQGPLAGLAKTSDAYKMAVRKIRSDLLNGELSFENERYAEARRRHMQAQIDYTLAESEWNTLRSLTDFHSSALRALSR